MSYAHIWTQPFPYQANNKRAFHWLAKKRLQELAAALRLSPGSYAIRSHLGGAAVSGHVVLHHEQLYVRVDHSGMGIAMGVLYRSCAGRRDDTGGQIFRTSLLMLEEIPALARTIIRDVPLTPPHVQQ